jgi:chromosome segregation ATPase
MEILQAVTELLKVLLGVGLVYAFRLIKHYSTKGKRVAETALLKHKAFDEILTSLEERLGSAYDKIDSLSTHLITIQGELLKARALAQEKQLETDRLAKEVKRLSDEIIRLEQIVRKLNKELHRFTGESQKGRGED